jgi:hypothetical protein
VERTTTRRSTTRADTTASAPADLPEDAFDTVGKYLALFGAVSAIVLCTVAVMAATGHQVTSFMWSRAGVLLALTPLLRRYAAKAARGDAHAFGRLRTLTTTMPVAVVAVDLVPGLCPPWYTVMQGLSVLALAGAAVLTRGAALSAGFPKR